MVSTEFGLKPISKIEIGEKVWAYNEESGEKSLQLVTHLIQREGDKEIVDIGLVSGDVIQATAGHPFYVNVSNGEWEWRDAGDLVSGTILTNLNNDSLRVASIVKSKQYVSVYNLTVDNAHTYYVGKGAVLSHNVSAGPVCRYLPGMRGADLGLATKVTRKAGQQRHIKTENAWKQTQGSDVVN